MPSSPHRDAQGECQPKIFQTISKSQHRQTLFIKHAVNKLLEMTNQNE